MTSRLILHDLAQMPHSRRAASAAAAVSARGTCSLLHSSSSSSARSAGWRIRQTTLQSPQQQSRPQQQQHHLILKRAGHPHCRRSLSSNANNTNKLTPHEPLKQSAQRTLDVKEIARTNGVRLTQPEVELLRKRLDADGNGLVSVQEFQAAGKQALEQHSARELCLSAVEQPQTEYDQWGNRLLSALDIGGKTLFAIVGTQLAGDAGMNVVGACLVGCISCLGGGTLNALMYGSSPLLQRPGVLWVRVPTIFYVAVVASIATFYSWPMYCRHQARVELRSEFDQLELDDSVSKKVFCDKCERDADFFQKIAKAAKTGGDEDSDEMGHLTPETLFDIVDEDGSGYIELDEMERLVGHRFNATATYYYLDTMALSALSVTAVSLAVQRGLHPLVATTSGVTVCFGGILRDVLCGRDLAVGGQSYALATGVGSTMYVLIRELSLRGWLHLPVVARIVVSAGATAAVRMWEFARGEPLLKPMHDHPKHYHKKPLARHKSQRRMATRDLASRHTAVDAEEPSQQKQNRGSSPQQQPKSTSSTPTTAEQSQPREDASRGSPLWGIMSSSPSK